MIDLNLVSGSATLGSVHIKDLSLVKAYDFLFLHAIAPRQSSSAFQVICDNH